MWPLKAEPFADSLHNAKLEHGAMTNTAPNCRFLATESIFRGKAEKRYPP